MRVYVYSIYVAYPPYMQSLRFVPSKNYDLNSIDGALTVPEVLAQPPKTPAIDLLKKRFHNTVTAQTPELLEIATLLDEALADHIRKYPMDHAVSIDAVEQELEELEQRAQTFLTGLAAGKDTLGPIMAQEDQRFPYLYTLRRAVWFEEYFGLKDKGLLQHFFYAVEKLARMGKVASNVSEEAAFTILLAHALEHPTRVNQLLDRAAGNSKVPKSVELLVHAAILIRQGKFTEAQECMQQFETSASPELLALAKRESIFASLDSYLSV